jgi:hypothetical protein
MEALQIALWIVLTIALWCAAFVLLWRVVLFVLSQVARWPELKQQYAITQPFSGPLSHSASGHIGPVWYARTLTLGSSPAGLYITAQFPFHFGTAPILIPWSDIEVRREKRLFREFTRFKFLGLTGLELGVWGAGGDWILEKAGPGVRARVSVPG